MTTAASPPAELDVGTGPGDPEGRRARRVAPWVAAGVAVAVTVSIAGGLAVGGRGPLAGALGSGPAVLHIGGTVTGTGGQGVVVDAKGLRAGRYVLTGSLPSSPTSGTATWLAGDSIDAARVTALAVSLGLSTTPIRDGQDWVVHDGGAVLRVYGQPGLPFAFDADPDDGSCPSIPTDGYRGRDTAVGCGSAATDQSTTPPGPDPSALRAVAGPMAGALGADPRIVVSPGTPYGSAMLDPTVDGVPTTGVGVTLQISAQGVVSASGWLAGFVERDQAHGDAYPLTPAKDAFAALASMPEPAIACAETKDTSSMCGGDVILTGATYGLSMAFDDERPVLVPSWLFTIKSSDSPMALVAVEGRYLADPTAPDSGSGGGSGSTDGDPGTDPAGGDPSPAAATDLPLVVEQSAPALADPGAEAAPDGPQMHATTISWTGPRSLTVTMIGGCELQTVHLTAAETPEAILLSYTFSWLPCPSSLSGPVSTHSFPVTLEADGGGRVVVVQDGTEHPEIGTS